MGDEWITDRVEETIARAERLLPGVAAPEGKVDPRWQAIIDVGRFVETDAETIWRFINRWGCHEDEDLRNAIATCLLEHLLEHHFDEYFPKVKELAGAERLFADTFTRCWKFGQAEDPLNARVFDLLQEECRRAAG